ncbi:AAA family ATPase [Candidatus Pacearchaeota archaeon]|nr:AAA family ATPase [Candidatus Pacearchaeota archaeon]
MIIGVTGMFGAGKGTIVEHLLVKGFKHYDMSGFITEEIVKRGMPVNRDSMIVVANDLRARFGPGYIADQLYERAKLNGGDSVIESLRCLGEIETLKIKEEFILLSIDADVEARYTRIRERNGPKDNVTFDEFNQREQMESMSNDPTKQNISACMEIADYRIKNDWTREELRRKIDSILEQIGKKNFSVVNSIPVVKEEYVRPTWDEYFMEICRVVARRATCDRGRSGCVIAKDKQLLVTGYVGSPNGLPHCDEVGHQIEATIHEDGVTRDHCIRTTHAEQNAICQAAKKGVAIEGSTLYCKMMPCSVCAKMIINSGIRRVVCEKLYQSGARDLMEAAGVKVEVLINEVEKY